MLLSLFRLVRDICTDLRGSEGGVRWQGIAIGLLQEAAEIFMVQHFNDASRCAIHAKRVTVKPEDMRLVAHLRRIHIGPEGLSGKDAQYVETDFTKHATAHTIEMSHVQHRIDYSSTRKRLNLPTEKQKRDAKKRREEEREKEKREAAERREREMAGVDSDDDDESSNNEMPELEGENDQPNKGRNVPASNNDENAGNNPPANNPPANNPPANNPPANNLPANNPPANPPREDPVRVAALFHMVTTGVQVRQQLRDTDPNAEPIAAEGAGGNATVPDADSVPGNAEPEKQPENNRPAPGPSGKKIGPASKTGCGLASPAAAVRSPQTLSQQMVALQNKADRLIDQAIEMEQGSSDEQNDQAEPINITPRSDVDTQSEQD